MTSWIAPRPSRWPPGGRTRSCTCRVRTSTCPRAHLRTAPRPTHWLRPRSPRLQADGMLVRDPGPRFHAYRMTSGEHTQTGIVGGASVAAYDAGRIRRHETTRPDKQADRAAQIEAVGAQTGPAFLIHRSSAAIARIVADGDRRPGAHARGRSRRGPSRALADQRPGDGGRPGGRVRRPPRALHRRRPPPQRRGVDGPRPPAHGRRPRCSWPWPSPPTRSRSWPTTGWSGPRGRRRRGDPGRRRRALRRRALRRAGHPGRAGPVRPLPRGCAGTG